MLCGCSCGGRSVLLFDDLLLLRLGGTLEPPPLLGLLGDVVPSLHLAIATQRRPEALPVLVEAEPAVLADGHLLLVLDHVDHLLVLQRLADDNRAEEAPQEVAAGADRRARDETAVAEAATLVEDRDVADTAAIGGAAVGLRARLRPRARVGRVPVVVHRLEGRIERRLEG